MRSTRTQKRKRTERRFNEERERYDREKKAFDEEFERHQTAHQREEEKSYNMYVCQNSLHFYSHGEIEQRY